LKVDLESERPLALAALANGNGHHGLPEDMDFEQYIASVEKSLIESALQQSGWVQTRAAETLRMSYRSLRHLMKKYRL
jgi:DNA-binding NtrC family response regulator